MVFLDEVGSGRGVREPVGAGRDIGEHTHSRVEDHGHGIGHGQCEFLCIHSKSFTMHAVS